jgi:Cu(I)/Ag(I) efflux system membrane protein CusA/SilA
MLGGLVTSAFLTLEVIPVLYTLWRSYQLRLAQRGEMAVAVLSSPSRDAILAEASSRQLP